MVGPGLKGIRPDQEDLKVILLHVGDEDVIAENAPAGAAVGTADNHQNKTGLLVDHFAQVEIRDEIRGGIIIGLVIEVEVAIRVIDIVIGVVKKLTLIEDDFGDGGVTASPEEREGHQQGGKS